MKWVLILIAVHVNDASDIPAKLSMTFESEQQCEKAKESIEYWIKFKSFKVEAKCQKQS